MTKHPAAARPLARRLARTGLSVVTALCAVAAFTIPATTSAQAAALNAPMVGIAPAASGAGYYLAGGDGGVFSFPNTLPFYGSLGGTKLNAPIVGIAVNPKTQGYVLAGSDGGVFTYNSPFYGSMGGQKLGAPVESVAIDPATQGYWLGAKDGGVFSFNAPFYGSLGGSTYPGGNGPTPTAQAIINAAKSQLGVPYVWGGETPGQGFDCSGLAQWSYAQAGLSIPRTSEEQWAAMQQVSQAQAVPGDLVFFDTPGDSQAPPNHVGIYIGNGLMIDAPYTGTVVRYDSITSDVLMGFATLPGV